MFNKNMNNKPRKLNTAQVSQQMNYITDFLRLIKPQLDSDEYTTIATEIRPIKRGINPNSYVNSYNTYHLEESDQKYLLDFLSRVNGEGYCLYYSVFDFEKTSNCTAKINNETARYTTILPIDFDNITKKDYEFYKNIFTSLLGIETVDINTGHGYQMIILLDKPTYNKNILKKFTYKLLQLGYMCDPAIIDSARIMRLPFTFNCKCLDPNSKYYNTENPIPINIVSTTDKRYSLDYIFEKLEQNKFSIKENSNYVYIDNYDYSNDYNVDKETETKTETKKETKTETKIKTKIETLKTDNPEIIDFTDVATKYPMINFDYIPVALKKMLSGSREGFRNTAILFMVPFFRNKMGYDIDSIKSILTTWGSLCTPELSKNFIKGEVSRIYSYNYGKAYGKWTEELTAEYGYFDFQLFQSSKDSVKIPNEVFDVFDEVSSGSFRIYMAMMLGKSISDSKNFKREDILKLADISYRTFTRNIKSLVKLGFVIKKKTAKTKGSGYLYYINPYFRMGKGFTTIDKDTVSRMLGELSNGAMKVLAYITRMIGRNKSQPCTASQRYLGGKLAKSQSGISKIVQSMHQKEFIHKVTIDLGSIKYCQYSLRVS